MWRLLTGIVKGKKREEVLAALADGSINILVGTHALIEDNVVFRNLGLAVIDEQRPLRCSATRQTMEEE